MSTVVRWGPPSTIARMQRDLDRLFGRMEATAAGRPFGAWMPDADVEQTEEAVIYKLDLPGLTKDDVHVSVHDHMLTISGERREQREDTHEGYLSRERSIGRFERSMSLPEGTDPDAIEAGFADGVLTVKVPREAESQPHHVPIS